MNRKNTLSLVTASMIALFSAVLSAGCGPSANGHLAVHLTDAPRDDFSDITVNLKEVQLVGDGGVVTALQFGDGDKKINLLDLQNTTTLLGDAEIPQGTYTQIRLVTYETGNTATPNGGAAAELRIASGAQTGAKLTGAAITVGEVKKEITLDWDLQTSATQVNLQPDGTYLMTPVLKLAQ